MEDTTLDDLVHNVDQDHEKEDTVLPLVEDKVVEVHHVQVRRK
jgi:hypothetical protein